MKFTVMGILIGSLYIWGAFFDFSPKDEQGLVYPFSLPKTGTGLILAPDRAPCRMATPFDIAAPQEGPWGTSSEPELGISEPQLYVWPGEGTLRVVPGNGPTPGIEGQAGPMPWEPPPMRYYIPKGNIEYFLRWKAPPPPFCAPRNREPRKDTQEGERQAKSNWI